MEYYDYCTGCLAIGVKMYSFKSAIINYDKHFLNYFRIPLSCEKVGEANFCFECAALLRKFEKFRSKCHRAQDVLSKIRQEHYQITKKNLQDVNREQHRLTSTISINPIECLTVNNIDNANISLVTTNNLISCDLKANINHNKNSIDVDIVKTEVQDIHKRAFDDFEDNFEQVENTHFKSTAEHIENKIGEGTAIIKSIENYIHKKRRNQSSKKGNKRETKKRKIQSETLTKDIFESVSDDEPLSMKVSRTTNKDLAVNGTKINTRKKFNVSYFEDYATVIFLTPDEAKKELLLRKESSNYINSPFKCEFCYRGYEAKAAFENHMKKHSKEYGDFICDICQLRFPEQRCLCKHRLASHKRKFCCKLCPYVCFCTHQAKTHVSLHKGKKYPCKECGEIFSMPNSLLMHKRLKHQTECVCDLCGNTFATPRGLYSHTMKVHRQEKNEKRGPKCSECDLHFATDEAWKRHLVLSSKHNVSNGCKKCGETFSNAEELKRHTRVHARKHPNRGDIVKLPATCTMCDEHLTDRTEYKSHVTSAHPHSGIAKKLKAEEMTPFVCELCGLTFKKRCYLRYHQRRHTGSRPHRCVQCGARFPAAGALAAHGALHRPRRLACALCRRGFTYKSALNKHMKVHLNIRPHRCDICDKAFISPCDVRLHIKYVHNKVPWPKRDRNRTKQDRNNATFT